MAAYSNYLNILLISEDSLKKYTLINDNVDGKYILPAIKMSQDVDLETLISTPLVNSLKYLIAENKVPTSDVLEPLYSFATTLLDDFITPYLCWQVMSNIQINLNYKMVNGGIVGNIDEKQSKLDYSKAQLLQEQYERYASAYAIKLKAFICDNRSRIDEIINLVKGEVGTDNPLFYREDSTGEKAPICGIYFTNRRYGVF